MPCKLNEVSHPQRGTFHTFSMGQWLRQQLYFLFFFFLLLFLLLSLLFLINYCYQNCNQCLSVLSKTGQMSKFGRATPFETENISIVVGVDQTDSDSSTIYSTISQNTNLIPDTLFPINVFKCLQRLLLLLLLLTPEMYNSIFLLTLYILQKFID